MLRVKDISKSLSFYQQTLGMKLQRTSENPSAKFNLYFLSYGPQAPEPTSDKPNPIAAREGILELTYNYGTEEDKDFKYHSGNEEPQGFGHVAIVVDDVEAACRRFDECGVSWKKRLTDGRMREIAFLFDPDGYWVEVVQNSRLKK